MFRASPRYRPVLSEPVPCRRVPPGSYLSTRAKLDHSLMRSPFRALTR